MADNSNVGMDSPIRVFSENVSDDNMSVRSALTEDQVEADKLKVRQTAIFRDSGTYDQEHESDLETHCRCPCGNTNFSHCIDPPPECLARRYGNTQKFPEMDVRIGRDSEIVKKRMQQHLLDETTKLRDIFTDYGMAVYNYAKCIHGNESPLYEILRLRYPEKIATTDPTSFKAVYEAVTDGVDFLNADPLERVLRECSNAPGNEHSNELLSAAKDTKKKYDDMFKKWGQLRAFLYVDGLRELRPPIPENTYERLKIKVEDDFAAFTIERAKKLEEKIRQILGIHKNVCLRLTEVEQGCIQVTFKVIGKILVENLVLDVEKRRALASHHISMLEYAGKVYYCCCNLVCDQDEVSSVSIKNFYERENHNDQEIDSCMHSPDCPSIQNKKLKCPIDECAYCGASLQFCHLQFHMMECEGRKSNTIKLHQTEDLQTSLSIESLNSDVANADSGYSSPSHDQDAVIEHHPAKNNKKQSSKSSLDTDDYLLNLDQFKQCFLHLHNGVHLQHHNDHAIDEEGETILNIKPRRPPSHHNN